MTVDFDAMADRCHEAGRKSAIDRAEAAEEKITHLVSLLNESADIIERKT